MDKNEKPIEKINMSQSVTLGLIICGSRYYIDWIVKLDIMIILQSFEAL